MKNLIFTLLIFIGFCSFTSLSQTQIGNAINGESIYDHLGCSVSLSSNGTIVAVRDHHDTNDTFDTFDTFDGRVRVYENLSGFWTQLGNDIIFDTVDAADWFSQSISLSSDGTTLTIGLVVEANAAIVLVYKNIDGVWTQLGDDIVRQEGDCFFGSSVSLSSDGNILAIGIPTFPMCSPTSKVRVYENIQGVWTQIGNDIEGEMDYSQMGSSVCLSSDGSIVAIGDTGNPYGDFVGSCCIYKNIEGSWQKIGNDIVGRTPADGFGNSVALSADGNIVAIGAHGNSSIVFGVSVGYVSFYKNIEGSWVQIGSDILGGFNPDGFGQCIDLSSDGTIAAIGSTEWGASELDSGKVSVYKEVAGDWSQIGTTIYGDANGDNFGASIGLSEDGCKLVVGAPFNDSNGDDAGQVKLFDFSALLSSDEFVKTSFSIYPNPATSHLNIQLSHGLILKQVYLYNSLGQLIKTSCNSMLDVSKLSKGLYYAQVVTNKGQATKEVIIN